MITKKDIATIIDEFFEEPNIQQRLARIDQSTKKELLYR